MPTNLKSLLSRSRSRNELKSREEKDGGETGSNGTKDCGTTKALGVCGDCSANEDSHHLGEFDQFRHCDISTRNAAHVLRNGSSCSHLVASYSELGNHSSPETKLTRTTKSSGKCHTEHSQTAGVPMRKCETVVTLTSLAGNSFPHGFIPDKGQNSSTTAPSGLYSNGANEKMKVTKNKILSTSSSTINCLCRSKLFSSWKLSSTNSENPEFASTNHSNTNSKVRGFNDTTDGQQMYRSQLSIPESGVGTVPMTPLNRLRRNVSINNTFYSGGANSSYSRSSSVASFGCRESEDNFFPPEILCRLCLCNVRIEETVEISECSCRYCKECITAYINFEIQEGAEEIACPDATCEKQGALSFSELESLIPPAMIEKHKKFRLYREVEKDKMVMWCPTPNCETICCIQEYKAEPHVDGLVHKSRGVSLNKSLTISCATCRNTFCAECKMNFHPGTSCESNRRKLIKQGLLTTDDDLDALDCIKKCPFCHVPIEKDSGCAQMLCRKCKHVFCWYCLQSLDDDFLLRHYDKGPCKNKLGHSRASVVWHRAQVIGIFAGFGVLVLLASPLLILAAPCLLCCRCRYCSKDTEESPVSL